MTRWLLALVGLLSLGCQLLVGDDDSTPPAKPICKDPDMAAWSHFAGGVGADSGQGVAATQDCNVILCGSYGETFEIVPGAFVTSVGGGEDTYIAMFDSAGEFAWHKRFGSASADRCTAVIADADEMIYVGGVFAQTLDPGGFPLTSIGGYDVFVAQMDPSKEGEPIWATSFGSTDPDAPFRDDQIYDLELDSEGRLAVAGFLGGQEASIPGIEGLEVRGGGFVAMIDGGEFTWVTTFGEGPRRTTAHAVAFDNKEDLLVAGTSSEQTWTLGACEWNSPTDSGNTFVAKLDGTTGECIWISGLYSPISIQPAGVGVSPSGFIYVGGSTTAGLTTSQADLQVGVFRGGWDVFLARFVEDNDDGQGAPLNVRLVGGGGTDVVTTMIMRDDAVVMLGRFDAEMFWTADASDPRTPVGGFDVFVAGYDLELNPLFAERRGGVGDDVPRDMAIFGPSYLVRGSFTETWTEPDGTEIPSNGDTDMFTISVTPPPP